MRLLAYRLGMLGGTLGIAAGAAERGLATILLSVLALGSIWALTAHPDTPMATRLAAIAGLAGPAAICFATAGALWIVPGTLLLGASAVLVVDTFRSRPAPRFRAGHTRGTHKPAAGGHA